MMNVLIPHRRRRKQEQQQQRQSDEGMRRGLTTLSCFVAVFIITTTTRTAPIAAAAAAAAAAAGGGTEQWISSGVYGHPNFFDELRKVKGASVVTSTSSPTTSTLFSPSEGEFGGGVGGGSSWYEDEEGEYDKSHVIEFYLPSGDGGEGVTFQLCEVTSLLPYTHSTTGSLTAAAMSSSLSTPNEEDGNKNGASKEGDEEEGKVGLSAEGQGKKQRSRVHEDSAAVLMAVYLFNHASSDARLASQLDSILIPNPRSNATSIVSASEELKNCNVKFTTNFLDTHSSPIRSTSTLTEIFQSGHTPEDPQPCAVLGPYSSMVTSPTAILSSVKNTPHVSYAASSTDFDNKEQYPMFARVCANNVADAAAVLSYLRDLNVTHLGMIFVTDSFGSSMAKSIQDSATEYDISVDPVSISFDSYTEGRQNEIVNAIKHLRNTKYRYFLGVMMDVHYEAVMSEAYKNGIVGNPSGDGEYVWLLSGVDTEMMADTVAKYEYGSKEAAASAGVGILRLTGPRDHPESSTTTTEEEEEEESNKDDTRAAFDGVDDENEEDVPTSAKIAAASVGEGEEEVVSNTNIGTDNYDNFRRTYSAAISDPTFVSYVESKHPYELDLPLVFEEEPTEWGHFLFDAVLGMGLASCREAAGDDNEDGSPGTSDGRITGDGLYNRFTSMKYMGASGRVEMDVDTGTRLAYSVTYEMLNIVPSYLLQDEDKDNDDDDDSDSDSDSAAVGEGKASSKSKPKPPSFVLVPTKVKIAFVATSDADAAASEDDGGNDSTANGGGEWKEIRKFVYASGGTETPPPLPKPDTQENYIGQPSRIAGLTLACLVMFLSFLFALWSLFKRSQHIVLASHPLFLVLLCLGCFVMASAIIPLSMEEPVVDTKEGLDTACMAFPWLYAMGFAIMFSALFTKTWQLYKVFRDPDLDCITVTPTHLLTSLVFFVSVNIILLLSWTFTYPLEWRRINRPSKDQFDRPIESYGTCTAPEGDERSVLAYVVVILAFNLCALLFANIRAYQARSIKTEYRESHYIAIAMASILQAWCLGVPIMIVVFETPQAKFWVEAGIIFVTSTATLLLMFVPKLIAHRAELIREEQERRRESHMARERRTQTDFDTDMDSSVPATHKGSVYVRSGETNPTTGTTTSGGGSAGAGAVVADTAIDIEKPPQAVGTDLMINGNGHLNGIAEESAPTKSTHPTNGTQSQNSVDVVGGGSGRVSRSGSNFSAAESISSSFTGGTFDGKSGGSHGLESQTTEELKAKLAATRSRNQELIEENNRIEKELNDLRSNTSTQ